MKNSPVVFLVGESGSGKTRFYTEFTTANYYFPTTQITPNFTILGDPTIVLVDTPGKKENRDKFAYSWQGVFALATIIVDFGNWSETEIDGNKLNHNPRIITWSGDNQETMKRIREYLQ